MKRYPYTDDALVAEASRYWSDRGARLLQAHCGDDEREHCAWLLEQLKPPALAHVLDIGSGLGGVADQMSRLRPDLRFTLLNISPAQLAMSSRAHRRVCGDMEELPFADQSFDCALICYALGHADADLALREARRVASEVLVFDIIANHRAAWRDALCYDVPERKTLQRFGEIEEIEHDDGGRFEPLLPGLWRSTGAREFIMRF